MQGMHTVKLVCSTLKFHIPATTVYFVLVYDRVMFWFIHKVVVLHSSLSAQSFRQSKACRILSINIDTMESEQSAKGVFLFFVFLSTNTYCTVCCCLFILNAVNLSTS